ncbi:MAG: cache domain-containing protein [Curvibacter sp.]
MTSPSPLHDTSPARLSRRRRFDALGVLVAVLAIAGLWSLAQYRIATERQQALAAAMQANARLAAAYERQVHRTLKAAEQVAAFVREQHRRQGARLPLADWVAQGVIREPLFNIISVVDAQGEIVSSSSPGPGRVNYADRDFFRLQRESRGDALFVSAPVLGRVSGRWQVPMSLRITRADGSFGGVVVLSVDPGDFTAFSRDADLGRQGLLELTGLDGVVRGRAIGEESRFGMEARRLPWFQRRLTTPQGEFVDGGEAVDGVARVVSYRSMADYPLMVVVGTSVDEVYAAVQQRHTRYRVWAAVLSALLLVLLAWRLRRRR